VSRKRAHRRTCPGLENCAAGRLKCRVRAKQGDYNSQIPIPKIPISQIRDLFAAHCRRLMRLARVEHVPRNFIFSGRAQF
jgi:hypothetical protein